MRTLLLALALLPLPAFAGGPDGPATDAAFRRAVNQAIDKGVAALQREQRPDGHWASGHDTDFRGGMTALSLFALAASGAKPDDAHLRRGMAALASVDIDRTYVAAVTLLALEAAYGNPPRRWYRRPTRMDEDSWHLAIRLTRDLVGTYQDDDHGWGYPLGPDEHTPLHRIDHSQMQLALLALKASCRMGLGRAVPANLWLDVLRTVLQRQERVGPKVPGPLATGLQWRRDAWRRYRVYPKGGSARGWDYDPKVDQDPVTMSMTAAGIASLLICKSELLRRRVAKYRTLDDDVDVAIRDALAWMAKHWTVERNAGQRDHNFHYYMLYGLERVGIFLSLEKIGGHDWYREGATLLLRQQGKDGLWNDPKHTSYALLFLKRATVPVLSGQSPPPPSDLPEDLPHGDHDGDHEGDHDGARDDPEPDPEPDPKPDDGDDDWRKRRNPLGGPEGSDDGQDPEIEDVPGGGKGRYVPFLGKKITRHRVAFVLDKSGSMAGGAMVKLRKAVDRALGALTEDHEFALLFYDGRVHYWIGGRLQKVTPATIKAAKAHVAAQLPKGGTEPTPALRAGLAVPGVEQVLFVTDGRLREHCYQAANAYLKRVLRVRPKEGRKPPARLDIIPVIQDDKPLEERYASRLKLLQQLIDKQQP